MPRRDDRRDGFPFRFLDGAKLPANQSRRAGLRPYPEQTVRIKPERQHAPRREARGSYRLRATPVVFREPGVGSKPHHAVPVLGYRPNTVRGQPMKERHRAPLM